MTTTKNIFQRPAVCGFVLALLTALTLASCASPSTQNDLAYGKALLASGSIKEAHIVLQRAQAEHPGDADIASTLATARERLATFLRTEGTAAMEQRRWDDAAAQFGQLAQIKGYEAQGQERLAMVAHARGLPAAAAPGTPIVPAPRVVSVPVVSPPVVIAPTPAPVVAASSAAAVQPKPTPTPVVAIATSSSAASKSSTMAPWPVAVPAATPNVAAAPVLAPVLPVDASKTSQPTKKLSPLDEALSKKVTLQFRDAPVRSLFDAIGKTAGLNIVIDKDVQQDLKTSIYLKDSTIRNALEKVVLTTHLGWRAMDDGTLLIYPDEPAKQNDYQGLVVRGFHLANADVKMVANSMKTVLKFKDVMVDEKLNMIVVRDTPTALALAEQLIALHDVPEPEVMLELAIIEVSTGKLQSLGIQWPSSISLSPLARNGSGTTSTTVSSGVVSTVESPASLTLRDLFGLGTSGKTLSLTMGGALSLNAGATDTDLNLLANPRIRAKNKEKAKILIGERVPNISATATSNGVVSQNITYVDVGLKLDVEPQIFPGNEIGLKIALEVSSINSTVENKANGTVAYRIGTRNATTVLRLKDGENQILGGLIQDSDRKTVSKVPLLGDIPILGRLFRSDATDKGKTELVLSITPRLIRGIAKPSAENESFDAGTVSSIRGRRTEGDSQQQQTQEQITPVQPQAPSPETNSTQRRSRDD